jgi:UDP-2,4-diacetamido-2,4,6-trideoxy-beta-L-altropyranose hydrolase
MRFDAGPAIGIGHAVRCLALAQALSARGARIAIASNKAGRDAIRRAAPGTRWPMRAAHSPAALRRAWPEGCAAVVVDSYALGVDFQRACRGWAAHVVAIDDLPRRRHDCDLLIDPTMGRRPADYRRLVPRHARVLAGRRYALLRPMFAKARRALSRRFGRDDRRVLVTLGGGDQSARLARLLRALPPGRPLAVRVLARRPARRGAAGVAVETVVGSFAVARHFAWADVALTAAGSTTWEMCCLGLPMVVLPIAPNQRDVAAALVKHRVGVAAAAADGARAWRQVLALLDDPRRRRAMSRAGRGLIDGRGAGRAADAILATIGGVP